ncbi:GNAT family N-acetyltransferase [Streptomyces sp. BI20]|uniref:GNAT family N-acetyltransferase n=1 Tax=Streptomyces sp. BI20 TaxID=3403460 RepID=UPI003C70E520
MSVTIRDERAAGRLWAVDEAVVVGHIACFTRTAEPGAGAVVVVHTVVEPGHEGRGIAGSLVRFLYDLAAREGVPVVPLCPYAAAWAEKHPDLAPAAPPEVVAAAKAQLAGDPSLW